MNQQYIYKDGKAIVIDHNGNQTTVDYYDKLREVLEQENLIEILDRKKWNLVGKQEEYEREYQKLMKEQRKGLKNIILSAIAVVAIGLLVPNLLNKPLINSILFIAPMLSAIGVGVVYGLISDSKAKKYILEKKENTEETLRKLESQLELQKQHLEKLKQDKTNTREKEGFHVSKLNGGITVMRGREDLEEFRELYDFTEMSIHHYHWNSDDNENSYFICDDENIEEKGYTFKKTLK